MTSIVLVASILTFKRGNSEKPLLTQLISIQTSLQILTTRNEPRPSEADVDPDINLSLAQSSSSEVVSSTDLHIVDGMRVLCLLWLIQLGVCQASLDSSAKNPWILFHYFQGLGFTSVYSANLGFDEFFFLSSFLATLKLMSLPKLSVASYCRLVLRRYLRLAPIYYLVYLFGWQLGPFLGSGPCWFTYEKGFANCSNYWWSVFTMTINFVPRYVIANEGCFFWGWYPPCDLQIYLFLPWIVHICLKLNKKAQIAFIAAGVTFGVILNFWLIWSNDLAAAMFAPQDIMIFSVFINKPYTKISSVFLGIGMALVFGEIKTNESSRLLKLGKCYVASSFAVAFLVICYVVFSPLSANSDPPAWSRLRNALFISLSRPAFILCLMVCMTNVFLGHGKTLRAFFASAVWVPMARLSYLVYLLFPILNMIIVSSIQQSLFISYNSVGSLLIGNYVF